MKFIVVFLLLLSSLFADRDGGPYLGFGYGIAQYEDNGYFTQIQEKQSESLTFYAGAYINKHLSVELSHVSFNAKGLADGFLVVEKDSSSEQAINFYATTISTLAHYPIFDDTLDLYARFGAGEIGSAIADASGFTMVYGAGFAYRFNKLFDIKIAYDMYQFGYDENGDKASDYRMKLDYIYTAIEVQF